MINCGRRCNRHDIAGFTLVAIAVTAMALAMKVATARAMALNLMATAHADGNGRDLCNDGRNDCGSAGRSCV